MTDGLVLTRRVSERGVHETAQRAGGAESSAVVRHYVGYEEWEASGFLRRERARHGVALILGFGDSMEVFADEVGGPVRTVGAFVVGNQSGTSLTGVRGHQLGIQVELTPGGALGIFGDVGELNDAVVPLDEAFGASGTRLVDRLSETSSWEARLKLLDESFGCDDVPALSPEVGGLVAPTARGLEGPGVGGAPHGPDRLEPAPRHGALSPPAGVAPKAYARMLRFDHARTLLFGLSPGRTLADVAMEAGYYDQSHLTRDFVALAGMTPGAFAGDTAPPPEVSFVQDTEPAGPADWSDGYRQRHHD